MGGTCGIAGCGFDARWIRVSQYGEGAALYVCDQHWNWIKLRNNEEAECYAGLPHHARMTHEVSQTERFATPSRALR